MYIVTINDDLVAKCEDFAAAYETAQSVLSEKNTYSEFVIKYCAGEPFKQSKWYYYEDSEPAQNHVENGYELEIHILRKSNGVEQFTGNIVQIKKDSDS